MIWMKSFRQSENSFLLVVLKFSKPVGLILLQIKCNQTQITIVDYVEK